MVTSPLTGLQVEFEQGGHGIDRYTVYYENNSIGRWILQGNLYTLGFGRLLETLRLSHQTLNQAEQRKVLALAASKIWREFRERKRLLYILESNHLSKLREEGLADQWQDIVPIAVDDLWAEARDLTFETKALMTLKGLALVENEPGEGVALSQNFSGTYGEPQPEYPGTIYTSGLVYGAVQTEARLVLDFLASRDWIRRKRATISSNEHTYISLAPEGCVMVDRINLGLSEVTKAFLICRFLDKYDHIYQSVYEKVGNDPEVACPIKRVKDYDHIDRITDKIVQEINEATVVVVDLSGSNFNVAFEAGYALSLGKPIVWTRSKRGRA
jgi:hypothetical protein